MTNRGFLVGSFSPTNAQDILFSQFSIFAETLSTAINCQTSKTSKAQHVGHAIFHTSRARGNQLTGMSLNIMEINPLGTSRSCFPRIEISIVIAGTSSDLLLKILRLHRRVGENCPRKFRREKPRSTCQPRSTVHANYAKR